VKKLKTTIGVIFCLFALTGCTAIIGINKPKRVKEGHILSLTEKYNVPPAACYELDTSYVTYLNSLDTAKYKRQIDNHYQPLQALYFNKSGQLKSFQINCYAGGFPNLKWDRDSILTTFPPRQQAPLDTLLSLERLLSFLKPTSRTISFNKDRYDYIVVVYWNEYMGRQSRRLIKFIQDNYSLSAGKSVKLVYANNDNMFSRPSK
jgi:hypothetical protein